MIHELRCPNCRGKDFHPVEINMKKVNNGLEGKFSCSLCSAKLVVFVNAAGYVIRTKKKQKEAKRSFVID